MKKEELAVLNMKAREMKRNGLFDDLRKLAQDNGIDVKVTNSFINSEILALSDVKPVIETTEKSDSSEFPLVDVVVPFYKSIEEKLGAESEALLKSVKDEQQKTIIKAQLQPVISFIQSNEDIKAKAFLNWKELGRCYKYMTDNAKKYALNGVACIADDTVYGWIVEYYNLDDQKTVEEERYKKALAEKKAAEAQTKAKESKPKKPRKTKAQKEAEAKAKAEAEEKAKAETKESENPTEVPSADITCEAEQEEWALDESMLDASTVSENETVNTSL